MEAHLTVSDLEKSYFLREKRIEVLRGVSFSVQTGEMLAVEGPSGAGKSTLLHLLGTLDLPSRGRIVIDGHDTSRMSADELARFRNQHIGFVFQFHHLLPEFTALENTMMPALIQRVPHAEAARRAEGVLGEVGLSHRLEHRPVELSGGEQQRVALARALVLSPKLLLADEPTGNLDEETGEGIHSLLFELNRRMNMTTVLVTHNPRLAARMGRRLRMRDGRVEPVPGGAA